jgi:dTDP-4-dehydrorhamnose reductase
VRIAVTGANGLLGGEAVAQLLAAPEQHAVLAIGRGPSRLPPGPHRWAAADLASAGETEAALLAFRPDAVLHAGALTDADVCERHPDLAWRANADGTAEVARACRALGARLVALSTDYVFDGAAGPYDEDALPNPRGAYARSKRCGEEAALVLAPGAAVARVAVVYGGRPGTRATFVETVIEKLSRGEAVRAFVDQQISTTLASAGAARCLELLLEHDFSGVLHVSDASVLGRVELARRIAARFGLRGEIVPIRTADANLLAPRPLRGGLLVARAAALLRNRPLSIDEALERLHDDWVSRRGPIDAPSGT